MVAPDFSQLPWIVPYQDILAIAGTDCVELLEVTNCYGGAAWARYHYTQTSPLIIIELVPKSQHVLLAVCRELFHQRFE